MWYSPETYSLVPSVSETTQKRIQRSVDEMAEIATPRPGVVVKVGKLEPQMGYQVMHLKTSPVHHTTLGVMPPGPPPEYVTPKGPVAQAGTHWSPAERFVPDNPRFPNAGHRIGQVSGVSRADRFDISNTPAFEAVCGKRYRYAYSNDDDFSTPTDADLASIQEARVKTDANYDELLAKWDTDNSRFDLEDVKKAYEETRNKWRFDGFTNKVTDTKLS